jgi:hypothetical protein
LLKRLKKEEEEKKPNPRTRDIAKAIETCLMFCSIAAN